MSKSQKTKNLWKIVYNLAKQCRSPFNLTKFQNSNFTNLIFSMKGFHIQNLLEHHVGELFWLTLGNYMTTVRKKSWLSVHMTDGNFAQQHWQNDFFISTTKMDKWVESFSDGQFKDISLILQLQGISSCIMMMRYLFACLQGPHCWV